MFERLERMPDDTILGLMAAYRADSSPTKVDLGVGDVALRVEGGAKLRRVARQRDGHLLDAVDRRHLEGRCAGSALQNDCGRQEPERHQPIGG